MKASLYNYRQSPRKVRLVVNLIKGKTVANAFATLAHLDKRAAEPVEKLLKSAVANAKNTTSLESDTLMIKDIRVDQGAVLKRSRPRARGRAFPIKKRTSHISLILAPKIKEARKTKSEARKNQVSKE